MILPNVIDECIRYQANYEMSKLLRHYSDGNTYFVTIVTFRREEKLCENFDILWSSLRQTIAKHNAEQLAWVVLPDHLHMILTPRGNDLSEFVHDFKLSFGSKYRKSQNLFSGRVWQNRFWDHIIRDQDDLNNHIDYIHYNPVKHGLAKNPHLWEYSSLSVFEREGNYRSDWGIVEKLQFEGEYGE